MLRRMGVEWAKIAEHGRDMDKHAGDPRHHLCTDMWSWRMSARLASGIGGPTKLANGSVSLSLSNIRSQLAAQGHLAMHGR